MSSITISFIFFLILFMCFLLVTTLAVFVTASRFSATFTTARTIPCISCISPRTSFPCVSCISFPISVPVACASFTFLKKNYQEVAKRVGPIIYYIHLRFSPITVSIATGISITIPFTISFSISIITVTTV